ncbi:hypothetical protein BDR26DRAFT_914384 [Obelidium mucronatum]|nr:hypothetical protein BDR26DRAFT_914384 [Obelidium mucronatum]
MRAGALIAFIFAAAPVWAAATINIGQVGCSVDSDCKDVTVGKTVEVVKCVLGGYCKITCPTTHFLKNSGTNDVSSCQAIAFGGACGTDGYNTVDKACPASAGNATVICPKDNIIVGGNPVTGTKQLCTLSCLSGYTAVKKDLTAPTPISSDTLAYSQDTDAFSCLKTEVSSSCKADSECPSEDVTGIYSCDATDKVCKITCRTADKYSLVGTDGKTKGDVCKIAGRGSKCSTNADCPSGQSLSCESGKCSLKCPSGDVAIGFGNPVDLTNSTTICGKPAIGGQCTQDNKGSACPIAPAGLTVDCVGTTCAYTGCLDVTKSLNGSATVPSTACTPKAIGSTCADVTKDCPVNPPNFGYFTCASNKCALRCQENYFVNGTTCAPGNAPTPPTCGAVDSSADPAKNKEALKTLFGLTYNKQITSLLAAGVDAVCKAAADVAAKVNVVSDDSATVANGVACKIVKLCPLSSTTGDDSQAAGGPKGNSASGTVPKIILDILKSLGFKIPDNVKVATTSKASSIRRQAVATADDLAVPIVASATGNKLAVIVSGQKFLTASGFGYDVLAGKTITTQITEAGELIVAADLPASVTDVWVHTANGKVYINSGTKNIAIVSVTVEKSGPVSVTGFTVPIEATTTTTAPATTTTTASATTTTTASATTTTTASATTTTTAAATTTTSVSASTTTSAAATTTSAAATTTTAATTTAAVATTTTKTADSNGSGSFVINCAAGSKCFLCVVNNSATVKQECNQSEVSTPLVGSTSFNGSTIYACITENSNNVAQICNQGSINAIPVVVPPVIVTTTGVVTTKVVVPSPVAPVVPVKTGIYVVGSSANTVAAGIATLAGLFML